MIRPNNASLKVYVYAKPTDMRKQINGLTTLVQQSMVLDPFSKSLFVFLNKRRDIIKILTWDKTGFIVWCKRLEKHRFPKLVQGRNLTLTIKELNLYLDGYNIEKFRPHETLKFENVA